MRVRAYVKRHSRELLAFALGMALFLIGAWQLDLIAAEKIDWTRSGPKREILPFWYMYDADAYVMFFAWIMIGVAIMCVTLWLWEER